MKKNRSFLQSEPINEPTLIKKLMQKNYTLPKLYVPKKNGKPTIEPGKRWYVWFLWRDPETGLLNKKFKYQHDINRYSKVADVKQLAKH